MALSWKPQPVSVDVRQLKLSPVEGFVISRIDGRTTVAELSSLTSLTPERLEPLLRQLVNAGAVEPEPGTPPPFKPPEAPAEVEAVPPSAPLEESDAEPTDAADAERAISHRALYQERFHALTEDARIALAKSAQEPELSAMCFDPLPAVIRAVLENPTVGLTQARLVAAHHQNTTGLEFLVARVELSRDGQVQRMLWRNPQLAEGQFRRLAQSKRLLELWKLAVNRDATAKVRSSSAKLMRQRFMSAGSEEKIELIFNTEGRSLGALSGLSVDGKTAALLCGRTYTSPTLVQNIAHWSSAPPPVIAHLLKQAIVTRQPQLRAALLRHPNAPASAKMK